MIEKIKNFLYDISDMVLSLLIIALIFYAVSWKISDTLSPDTDISKNVTTESEKETPDKETEVAKTETTPSESTTPSTTEGETADTTTPPTETETPTDPKETTDTQTEDNKPETPATNKTPEKSAEMVIFTVESGSSGYSIGKSLEEKGFVNSADDFTKRIIELGVDNKLKAGDFKISTSDSLDVIIDVLIGKGRS